MLHHIIDQFLFRLRLARTLRLRRKLGRLNEVLALKERFPHAGRYQFGDLEVLRFDRSGGYDMKQFLADHPAVEKKFHTPQYEKPRVAVVEVKESRLARV